MRCDSEGSLTRLSHDSMQAESVSGSNLVFDIPAFRRATKVAAIASQECPPVDQNLSQSETEAKRGVMRLDIFANSCSE
jgi:hypothetical protein